MTKVEFPCHSAHPSPLHVLQLTVLLFFFILFSFSFFFAALLLFLHPSFLASHTLPHPNHSLPSPSPVSLRSSVLCSPLPSTSLPASPHFSPSPLIDFALPLPVSLYQQHSATFSLAPCLVFSLLLLFLPPHGIPPLLSSSSSLPCLSSATPYSCAYLSASFPLLFVLKCISSPSFILSYLALFYLLSTCLDPIHLHFPVELR